MKINIYLKQEQKSKLNCICFKYQVSISTIAEKLLFLFTKYMIKEDKGIKERLKTIGCMYIYPKDNGSKTCISPNGNHGKFNEQFKAFENLSRAYTNVLQMYLRRELDKYLNKEDINKLHQDLNHELQITNEPNWNYNQFVRSMKRYERKQEQCEQ